MQNPTGRTRRQTRQSAAAQAAAAERAAGRETPQSLNHYTPGASLGVPTGAMATRSSQGTRTTRRTTRSSAAMEQETTRTPLENPTYRNTLVQTLRSATTLTPEEIKNLVEPPPALEGEQLTAYVKGILGEERWPFAVRLMDQLQTQQLRQRYASAQVPDLRAPLYDRATALMQQNAATTGAVQRPPAYAAQRLMGQYSMPPVQMQVHGMAQQSIRPLAYGTGLAQQLTPRQDPQAFQQNAVAYTLNPRSISSAPALQTPRPRMATGQGTGEVAKTLMASRSDSQSGAYGQQSYLSASTPMAKPIAISTDYALHSLTADSRMETPSAEHKRVATAPVENGTGKSARYAKTKRGVEDPSAPDVGDMDVVTEAAIHLAEEQEALLNDVPSQSVTDADGHVVESALLNVNTVKTRLHQVMREQGMQLAGMDCVELMVRGMEEKFEGFLKQALSRAIHRCDTGHVVHDSETRHVTSDVRSKLREIKKKQEQYKAAKLREEREKLEQLAETASKKELASNKELAAKVERVKRQKQFNAESEAANRALSNALGGLGFEKIRIRREKEAREAAAAGRATMPPPVSAPPLIQPLRAPMTTSAPPSAPPSVVAPKPVVERPPVVEEKRPVVLTVKDIVSAMSLDRHYAYSPLLYRQYL